MASPPGARPGPSPRAMPAKPSGCHNRSIHLKSHEVVFDADCHDETSLVREVRRSSTKPSTNDPG
jgi:hypothetical protein